MNGSRKPPCDRAPPMLTRNERTKSLAESRSGKSEQRRAIHIEPTSPSGHTDRIGPDRADLSKATCAQNHLFGPRIEERPDLLRQHVAENT